ncbi:MAG: hypothetical protein HYY09_05690 [Firmicutes bacterium]|nr:hypothetical protein [Bacillota bacterium]
MSFSPGLGVWIAGLLSLMVYSFLWRDNPLYRAAEHAFVGLAAAYSVVLLYHETLRPRIVDDLITAGKWQLLFPILLGVLIYASFSNRYAWLARIPIAFWLGYGAGKHLAYDPAVILTQVKDSFIKLDSINNILLFLGIIGTISYFLFTLKSQASAPVRYGRFIGKWTLMVAFGALFGQAVTSRISTLLGYLGFLFGDWLHIL